VFTEEEKESFFDYFRKSKKMARVYNFHRNTDRHFSSMLTGTQHLFTQYKSRLSVIQNNLIIWNVYDRVASTLNKILLEIDPAEKNFIVKRFVEDGDFLYTKATNENRVLYFITDPDYNPEVEAILMPRQMKSG